VWNELENKKAFDQNNAHLNEQLAKTVRFDYVGKTVKIQA
jgi:hypothetical protein